MNNDLISRSALIDALPVVTTDRKVSLFGVVFDFVDMICNAPAVDAVAVVRCRECLYWQDNNGGYPHEDCRWGKGETPDADDFCSYGERKDGADG